jgi:pyruvate/2-oxoglutarate dehydrogenase complex dihydrolipoamide dehydrogenase (E3) component
MGLNYFDSFSGGGKMAKKDSEQYNVVVIGGGSAGLVSALICATLKAKVALIEKHKMGGDCLNYGCVPSKAIIRTARFVHDMQRHKEFGVANASYDLNLGDVMDRVHKIIGAIEPHDSMERFRGLGVECFEGDATIVDKHTVRVGDQTLKAKTIIMAMGASPFVPPIKGLDQITYRTSENLWQLRDLPKRFVVLGGGPIGCEMAQSFQRLGSQVTLVEMADKILAREDEDVGKFVIDQFNKEGLTLLTGAKATEVIQEGGEKVLICETKGGVEKVPFDEILVAVGRRANTDGVDWDKLGIKLNPNATIKVDEYLRANGDNMYAAGDVAGPYQFTHTASHMAYYCAVNAMFSPFYKAKVNYDVIPWVTFTDPEIAQVGINETVAKQKNIPYEITTYKLDLQDRFLAEGDNYGQVKVLTEPGKDKILGANIVAHNAGELLTEYIHAMKKGFGLKGIQVIHPYPIMSEANAAAAGEWRKAHKPEGVLKFVEKFHRWRR